MPPPPPPMEIKTQGKATKTIIIWLWTCTADESWKVGYLMLEWILYVLHWGYSLLCAHTSRKVVIRKPSALLRSKFDMSLSLPHFDSMRKIMTNMDPQ